VILRSGGGWYGWQRGGWCRERGCVWAPKAGAPRDSKLLLHCTSDPRPSRALDWPLSHVRQESLARKLWPTQRLTARRLAERMCTTPAVLSGRNRGVWLLLFSRIKYKAPKSSMIPDVLVSHCSIHPQTKMAPEREGARCDQASFPPFHRFG
jgi:hypothetical protein